MRRRAKRDQNEKDIVRGLRKAGASVAHLDDGNGVPDLLVGFQGRNTLLEVKTGCADSDLNDKQIEWHLRWRGQVAVVTSLSEALDIVLRRNLDPAP